MDYEKEINDIKSQLNLLQIAFVNAQRNDVNTVGRVDDTENKITSITPEILSKQVYIGEKEVIFESPKAGNVSAWVTQVDGVQVPCTTEVTDRIIKVIFDPLVKVAIVNVSIQ